MTPPDLLTLLGTLRTPTSAAEVAERFSCSRKALEGVLRQLQARGLVSTAEPGLGACASGCGMCSMRRFCPSSETDTKEKSSSLLAPATIWRITPLGESTIAPRQRPPSGVQA